MRGRAIAAVVLLAALLGGCDSTATVKSSVAAGGAEIRRLAVRQSIANPPGFQERFAALLDGCGITHLDIVRVPRPLLVAPQQDTEDPQLAAEAFEIRRFAPDAVLSVAQSTTLRQGSTVRGGAYALRLVDMRRREIWKAEVELRQAGGDAAEILANEIFNRMIADGAVRCARPA